METETNIIELIDEDDRAIRFEHIITLDYGDREYIIIKPLEFVDGVEEDDIVILRVEQDVNGEDIYVGIEDEEEVEEVFEAFIQIVSEEEIETD
jgi:uncharacterized protein YrzB (UPF0473 family)